MKKNVFLLSACFLLSIFLPAHLLADAFEIADTFERPGGSATLLNDSTTTTGGARWVAMGNLKVKKEGDKSWVVTKDTRSFRGSVSLPSKEGVITVEAEVRPVPSGEKDNWVGIGLGPEDPSLSTKGIAWPGGLFLLASSKGSYQCVFNATPDATQGGPADAASGPTYKVINSAAISGFGDGRPVKLSLTYDIGKRTVTMSVNDVVVMDDLTLRGDQQPNIECAGISGFNQKTDIPAATNFRVYKGK